MVGATRLDDLRSQLPSTSVSGYFNAGSNGPIPRIAFDTLLAAATDELEAGRIAPGKYEGQTAQMVANRAAFASVINADPSEIGLMRSTTEGLNAALMGIIWRPGDEVVTTSLEHICLFSTLGLLAHRHGVAVRTVPLAPGADALALTSEAITPRTRAIVISHLSWSTGAIMPIAEIAAFARSRGILTIIDAAQSTGQIPIDVKALGVDAYAMSGQKWLGGPDSTGALFVRTDRLGDILPTYMRAGTFDVHGFVTPKPGAARYEMGGIYAPMIAASTAAIEWWRDEVGMAMAHSRTRELGRRFYDGISAIPGVSVVTPASEFAGIVCFTVVGVAPAKVVEVAYERGYTIRHVDQPPSPVTVRVSTGWWCREDEVDGLIEVIASIAGGNGG